MTLTLGLPPLPGAVRAVLASANQGRFQLRGEALRIAADLQGHLRFAEELLRGQVMTPEQHADLSRLLARIQNRMADPRLVLGVVGEFSTGKSTLINALLRDDLLRRHIVQGTTTTATLISYGPRLDVEATFRHGTSYYSPRLRQLGRQAAQTGDATIRAAQKAELLHFLHRLTSSEKVAREVNQVDLYHPAELLKDGLVLVDTPGANIDNPRHAEVTKTALRDLCDAALVIIPATEPGALSLFEFLGKHLADVLHRCVFVVTMIDRIRPREREEQITFLRKKLMDKLNLTNPLVLPVAPMVMLDSEEDNHHLTPTQHARLVEQFEQAEDLLWRRVREERQVILTERIAHLLMQSMEQLKRPLRLQEEGYRRRHEALERNRIPDLDAFIHQARTTHSRWLRHRTRDLPARAAEGVRAVRDLEVNAIKGVIDEASTAAELEAIFKERIPAILETAAGEVCAKLEDLERTAAREAHEEYNLFRKRFRELYNSLQALAGEMSVSVIGGEQPDRSLAVELSLGLSGLKQMLEQVIQTSFLQSLAGGGIGAFLGTLLLPGAGTVLGWWAGRYVGNKFGELFGPSLEDLKSQAKEQVSTGLTTGFADIEARSSAEISRIIDLADQQLTQRIEQNGRHYANLVASMIARDRNEAAELASARRKLRAKLEEIEVRLGQLARILERLRTL